MLACSVGAAAASFSEVTVRAAAVLPVPELPELNLPRREVHELLSLVRTQDPIYPDKIFKENSRTRTGNS